MKWYAGPLADELRDAAYGGRPSISRWNEAKELMLAAADLLDEQFHQLAMQEIEEAGR
jgi:hypothetical protein